MATMTWGRAGTEPLSRAGAAGPPGAAPPAPHSPERPTEPPSSPPTGWGPWGEREVSPRLAVPAVQASADPRLLLELDSGRQPCPPGAESRRGGRFLQKGGLGEGPVRPGPEQAALGTGLGAPGGHCFSSSFLCPARGLCWSSMLSGFLTSGPSSTITHVAPLRGLTWGRGRPCPDAASGQWLGRDQQEGPDGRATR